MTSWREFWQAVLYIALWVLLLYSCSTPTDLGDEMRDLAPPVVKGTAKADIWTVQVNDQHLTLTPGTVTEVNVGALPATVYAWLNGTKGPRFQFVRDMPACPVVPPVNSAPFPMRVTYGDSPDPWPLSMRVEENGASWSLNAFTQDWVYLQFEMWDAGYSAPSPWLRLIVSGNGDKQPDVGVE